MANDNAFTYSFTVDNLSASTNNNIKYWSIGNTDNTQTNTYTNTVACTSSGCCCGGWHYYYPNYGWWWYPTAPVTVYKYQIFCPKPYCKGKFWAELDEIKKCPVCSSKIKVTTDKESDYEVAVTK